MQDTQYVSESKYCIKSVQKALKILKLFDVENFELSLTEISDLLDLNKSSVLRLVETLRQEGFLKQDEETKKYKLSVILFKLGTLVYESMNLKKIARPYLEKAANETGLVVHLGILEKEGVVVLEKIWPNKQVESIRMVSRTGGIIPIHCTAIGKVLLAFKSEKEIREIMKNKKLTKYTPTTITDLEEFLKVLRETKKYGYAVNNGEHEPYIKALAYPIFDDKKQVVAAMSLTGLREAMNEKDQSYLCNLAKEISLSISRELGCLI